MDLREFTDQSGTSWHVWEVDPARAAVPGNDRRRSSAAVSNQWPRRVPPAWLCFDSAGQRCRVSPVPSNWRNLSDAELAALCETVRHVAPAAKTHEAAVPRIDSPAEPAYRCRSVSHPCVVLIVEDNDDSRMIYATYFRHMGYTVLESANGETGLALARSERPDVILMDGGLPIVDGWTAAEALKADPSTAHIRIVMLTAHVEAEHRERSVSVGADGYLTKPADPKDVVSEIERVCALGSTAVTAPISMDRVVQPMA